MGVFWHAAAFKKQDKVEIQEVLRELAAGRNEFEIELEACTVVECEAGDSQRCYELIGDFDAYYGECRLLPVGKLVLERTFVFHERSGIDRALKMLFSDLEHANQWLSESSLWSGQNVFPGGVNNYNRWRRQMGLLED
ncbi:MAG: hypothetical protein HFH78_05695 [Lachnospiraceae bacterium]|nr:hypothetical protein [Lachnospiraceae bacterium]